MGEDGRIDYVEFPGGDLIATKRFYELAFGWAFTDYGPTYAAFDEGIEGGLQADTDGAPAAPLPVLYSDELEATLEAVQTAGGTILKPIFPDSDTIPKLIQSLGIADPIKIDDPDYDNMFVIVLGAKPRLVRMHY